MTCFSVLFAYAAQYVLRACCRLRKDSRICVAYFGTAAVPAQEGGSNLRPCADPHQGACCSGVSTKICVASWFANPCIPVLEIGRFIALQL